MAIFVKIYLCSIPPAEELVKKGSENACMVEVSGLNFNVEIAMYFLFIL